MASEDRETRMHLVMDLAHLESRLGGTQDDRRFRCCAQRHQHAPAAIQEPVVEGVDLRSTAPCDDSVQIEYDCLSALERPAKDAGRLPRFGLSRIPADGS